MRFDEKLTRRDALKTLAATRAGAALAGCGMDGRSGRVAVPDKPIRLGKVEIIQYEPRAERRTERT